MGFVGFGGSCELWLPAEAQVMVAPGQQVLAGSVLLGGLPAAPQTTASSGGAKVME
jgi:phosphatidylserine decarboxylase